MNKIIIGLLVVAGVALVAWLMFSTGEMVMEQEYSIDDEVAELEAELIAVEAAVAAGTLTPQDAAASQARISSRLEVISGVSAQAQSSATLTAAQRAQLSEGLSRLQTILVTYQATLQVVDEQVLTLPEAERPQLFRGRTSVREAIEAAAVEVDVVVGGVDAEVEMGIEGETEVEADIGTTVPDAGEVDVVDEEEDSSDTNGIEIELQGGAELETATSN